MSDTNTTTTSTASDLAVDPDAHTTAIARAEAAFATATALAPSIRCPGAHIHHVLAYGVDKYRQPIRHAVQSLAYLARQGVARGDVVDSAKRGIIAAANEMEAVFDRIVDPATRMSELERIYAAIPGVPAGNNPFRVVPPIAEGTIMPVPTHMHPVSLAMEAMRSWERRGIRVTRSGADGLMLDGPGVHDGDRATATQVKAEILARLPQPIVI